MWDSIQSAAAKAIRCPKSGHAQFSWNIKPLFLASQLLTGYKDSSFLNQLSNSKCARISRHRKLIVANLGVSGSNAFGSSSGLRLEGGGDDHFELGLQNGEDKLLDFELGLLTENEALDDARKSRNDELRMLNFDEPQPEEGKPRVSIAEDLMAIKDNGKNNDLEMEDDQAQEHLQPKPKPTGKLESRSRKQLMKRSSILARQVIGIESARSLGFVSQLWVDTATWAVLEVEVKPNLLSSESGRFLLEDIYKVGDVVLVQEDNFMLNEIRTVGLETLVGYSILTPRRRNLGKVRGYTFNINSGAVESLELDAFGYSVIPSSLVSTYALFTEDVLEVVSDVIIVHEAAASRIQRLTKGFLGATNAGTSNTGLEYREKEEESTRPIKYRKSRRKSNKQKFNPRTKDLGDDFELPMDYM